MTSTTWTSTAGAWWVGDEMNEVGDARSHSPSSIAAPPPPPAPPPRPPLPPPTPRWRLPAAVAPTSCDTPARCGRQLLWERVGPLAQQPARAPPGASPSSAASGGAKCNFASVPAAPAARQVKGAACFGLGRVPTTRFFASRPPLPRSDALPSSPARRLTPTRLAAPGTTTGADSMVPAPPGVARCVA